MKETTLTLDLWTKSYQSDKLKLKFEGDKQAYPIPAENRNLIETLKNMNELETFNSFKENGLYIIF